MDRRESIKYFALSALSGGVLLEACKGAAKKDVLQKAAAGSEEVTIDRFPEEKAADAAIKAKTFFTQHEMETIAVLSDIIIPADGVSGSATEAGVPDFIAFIVNDMPYHQVPLRGGLRWLDLESVKRFGTAFKESDAKKQLALVDAIAYPEKAAPDVKQGVAFFTLMRNLVTTGFYTSKIGITDLGYKGNTPNQWNGVPADVLKQYGLAYTEKELKECISYT
jgi:gluconate 2-dehydrogenase gamma chain